MLGAKWVLCLYEHTVLLDHQWDQENVVFMIQIFGGPKVKVI